MGGGAGEDCSRGMYHATRLEKPNGVAQELRRKMTKSKSSQPPPPPHAIGRITHLRRIMAAVNDIHQGDYVVRLPFRKRIVAHLPLRTRAPVADRTDAVAANNAGKTVRLQPTTHAKHVIIAAAAANTTAIAGITINIVTP